MVNITFTVITPNGNDSTKVFISGNNEILGNWQPGKNQLHKTNKTNEFAIALSFPQNAIFDYKFTRGTWDTERLQDDGTLPANFSHTAHKDTTLVFTINRWRDQGIKYKGQITGTVEYHRNMAFPGILNRDVIVWLPPGYEKTTNNYAVIYMHDGQNIIDPSTSYAGIDWQVDETADSLIRNNKIEPIIIVGIYNSEERTPDYSDTVTGRAYQKFIIEKLKPLIDTTYRTNNGAQNTAIFGSSMGGLASFLLAWNHPEVFGKAGCFSPAFIAPFDSAVSMVNSAKHKKQILIYIDNGTVELEARLQPGCDAMLKALRNKGYRDGDDLMWFLDEGAEHNEAAWGKRFWRSLVFLFPAK